MRFIPGILLARGCFVYTYRSFSGRVKLDGQGTIEFGGVAGKRQLIRDVLRAQGRNGRRLVR
jgi:hypothetical protein